ncbi:3'-5' exoribonuclease domain-containing protein [Thiolapillus sp.]
MNLYLDTEFTGLRQDAMLISLALVADDGRAFYAEFTDFDRARCDDWIRQNVLVHCRWLADEARMPAPGRWREGDLVLVLDDREGVRAALGDWLARFDAVEVWADCPPWDWVLFCELFGGAFGLPDNIHYLPMDLATLFKARGLDPDTDRAAFAVWKESPDDATQVRHNALYDARLTRACHRRLMENGHD